jgi:phosphohistidine swiveling domain-containing protein
METADETTADAARPPGAAVRSEAAAAALRRLGDAAAWLAPYLDHSGASDEDVLALAEPGGAPWLDGLREAEGSLGPAMLREVIGRVGWSRLAFGFSAQPLAAVSVGGSFPFLVPPAHAPLLAAGGDAQTLWRRHLVLAHGGAPADGSAPVSDDTVSRFRAYNVAHAQLLDEILAVAPFDAAKARRLLALMDGIVADFAALFGGTSDDASRVGDVYGRLRARVEADLARDEARGALSTDTVRRVQMFEDASRLEDVTTVHGLKRYLHQQGLRLAFRLFRSEGAANRTVDLLVVGEREILRCEQPIRYLEFEPTPRAGAARLPFAVSLLADALGRQLLHGRKLPSVTVLVYGNELQIYVRYRNHPAFIRIDLSPPLRGGLIDLEYFGASQYELEAHPDLSLQGIQRVLRELEFDVSSDGLRLRARYDKERAADLGDLVARVRALFDLLPYLMDVDWVIGDLEYPPPARAEVAAAWARFFARWGVVPMNEVLSASRLKILVGVEPDAAGPREVAWDGRLPYRDRFSGTPPDGLGEALRRDLERRGLGEVVPGVPAARGAWGQRALDETVLRPLADAAARGEVLPGPAGVEPASPELFRRDHEAARLAEVLSGGGGALARAVHMARLVRDVERQARFRTTGTIQGYAVQAAALPTAPDAAGLFVLRDAQGIVRLALAARGGVLYRARAASGREWREGGELEVADLARTLRAYNYLGAQQTAIAPAARDVEEARAAFSDPSPAPVPRQTAGDRLVPATVAAPGRATGFACFHTAGRTPADLDGAVLVSRAFRPEDAPWLRHAAGLVSTGGGVLSHVGLLALELEKPALIVDGRWSAGTSGAEVLLVRRPQWREQSSAIGAIPVVCRHDMHDVDEALEPGDLVAVDGECEGLVVLGHDPLALALHQDLRQLEVASTALAATDSDAEILAWRGRLVRAVHQLEKLLARLDRPALVRHAVRELLTLPRAPSAPEGREARTRLVSALLRSPSSEEEARRSAAQRIRDLRERFEAARRASLADLERVANPAEALFARLAVRRVHDTLADALELVGEPRDPAATAAADAVDAACRARLERLRAALAEGADRSAADPGERWRLRHLLPRLEEVGRALGDDPGADHAGAAAALRRADEVRVAALRGRRVLDATAGGLELGPLVGGKAAHLGEIVRVLGAPLVPAWFAVGDAALREMLGAPVPAPTLDLLGLAPAADLAAAIARASGREGWDARRQASAIRELWQSVALPPDLAREIAAAYAALAPARGEEAMVAIRSSGREEDGQETAWAGVFDTFLFVHGLDAVLEHLKLAWAGFWTERAIDQRGRLGAGPAALGGGVIVQRMIDPRASGVLHTVSAATGQLREMVVNVGLGLGEGVVSGTVDVDHVLVSKDVEASSGDLRLRYRVGDKREQVVRDRERGTGTRRQETRYHERLRPALEYAEIRDLVQAAARLEEALVEPLDIEFAFERGGLWILQARPVALFDAVRRETLARHPLRAGRPAGGKEPP